MKKFLFTLIFTFLSLSYLSYGSNALDENEVSQYNVSNSTSILFQNPPINSIPVRNFKHKRMINGGLTMPDDSRENNISFECKIGDLEDEQDSSDDEYLSKKQCSSNFYSLDVHNDLYENESSVYHSFNPTNISFRKKLKNNSTQVAPVAKQNEQHSHSISSRLDNHHHKRKRDDSADEQDSSDDEYSPERQCSDSHNTYSNNLHENESSVYHSFNPTNISFKKKSKNSNTLEQEQKLESQSFISSQIINNRLEMPDDSRKNTASQKRKKDDSEDEQDTSDDEFLYNKRSTDSRYESFLRSSQRNLLEKMVLAKKSSEDISEKLGIKKSSVSKYLSYLYRAETLSKDDTAYLRSNELSLRGQFVQAVKDCKPFAELIMILGCNQDNVEKQQLKINHYLAICYNNDELTPKDANYIKSKNTKICRNGQAKDAIEHFIENRKNGTITQTVVDLYEEFVKTPEHKNTFYRTMLVSNFYYHMTELIAAKRLSKEAVIFYNSCKHFTSDKSTKKTIVKRNHNLTKKSTKAHNTFSKIQLTHAINNSTNKFNKNSSKDRLRKKIRIDRAKLKRQ